MGSSDMGMAEYLHRSGELVTSDSSRGGSPRAFSFPPLPPGSDKAPRRGTPMPDGYVRRKRRSPKSLTPTLPEAAADALLRPASHRLREGSGVGFERPSSGTSGRSGTSSADLMDMRLEGCPPHRQSQMVRCVVGALEDDEDWLGLAVYLSVVGQFMAQQVGDVNLGPVRHRLAGHVQRATQGSIAGTWAGLGDEPYPDPRKSSQSFRQRLWRKVWPKKATEA